MLIRYTAMTRPRITRRRLLVAIILLAAYLSSYAVMSARGDWVWSQTGKVRYDFGFAISDVIRWDPAAAHWEPFRSVDGSDTSRGNFLGYFYLPLIRVDRGLIHPDTPAIPGAG